MKIQNQFSIPLPPEEAWRVLNDIPRVAGCVPGATLLEQTGDASYLGTVAVRLGPVALSFKGTFTYKEVDESAHRVRAEASGNEQKARGTARADVEFSLAPENGGTRVDVETDVQLAGSIAQYARGGALIQSTAQVLMDQFARNLAREFETAPAGAGTDPAQAGSGGAPAGEAPPRQQPARSAPAELSGLTLLWQGILHALRGMFGKAK